MHAEEKKSLVRSLVGEEYEVEIGPVAHGGHCIARTDAGQVLFVRRPARSPVPAAAAAATGSTPSPAPSAGSRARS